MDRSEGRNREALARLDEGLARQVAAPTSRPIDEARLRHTKGTVLSEEGAFDGARAELEQAQALYVRELGPRHRLVGEVLYDQAQNAYLAGELDLALGRTAESRAILETILDETNPFRAHVLALEGQILFGQNKLGPARAALDRAVEIYRKALGGPSYVIGISEVYLALIASGQGEPAAALAYLDDAKRNYDASYGRLHPNHGDLLVNRAIILDKAGRRSEARSDCAQGLRILEETLGRDHSFTKDNRKICEGLRG
ncbi:tetratricopeptide repeat protein [Thermaurantiacus sp.]